MNAELGTLFFLLDRNSDMGKRLCNAHSRSICVAMVQRGASHSAGLHSSAWFLNTCHKVFAIDSILGPALQADFAMIRKVRKRNCTQVGVLASNTKCRTALSSSPIRMESPSTSSTSAPEVGARFASILGPCRCIGWCSAWLWCWCDLSSASSVRWGQVANYTR